MIITLKIECIFGRYLEEECIRVIEIPTDATLCDLHLAIQHAIDFDDDHLFEFYAGKHIKDKRNTFYENDDLTLDEVYPLQKGLKLYYLFDFGDSWTFKITKSRKRPVPPVAGIKYPRVVQAGR
ncbi:MAG: IS1096 element passenger TnpR family protein [Candidatus Loosdrechtia sp.]|uniref:IS1096 element passenger TnpR family protein n=1 Tax=Candidatus Loosdrechtia sp. TaxID=3101272 RepID=UPI003A690315|nr:MAG: hypothetical protein QY305_14435 [Candidatus Jettenia sp. AMX2]